MSKAKKMPLRVYLKLRRLLKAHRRATREPRPRKAKG